MFIDLIFEYIDLVVFFLFCLFEGMREGAKDSHGGSNGKYPFNVHLFYMPTRIIFVSFCISLNYSSIDSLLLLILSYALIFPFIHDGAYFSTRRQIEPNNPELINYHWFGWSDTTTAVLSFSPFWRSVFFTIGMSIYTFYEIWQGLLIG